MKRLFLLNLVVLVVFFSFLSSSCKKTTSHPDYPTPGNNRIMSYSKFTTSLLQTPVNENFSFFYDGQQRLIQILYSTNDQTKAQNQVDDLSITFTYSNDSIYKTITATRLLNNPISHGIIERDTFLQNASNGFITTAYTPGFIDTFTYYHKLLAGNTVSVYDSGTTVSATSTYTSDNGDLLIRSYDGTLHATFPDSGIQWLPYPHDTILSVPLTVTWTTYGLTASTNAVHTANGYSDVFSGNTTGNPVSVQVVDPYGVVNYGTAITWPGGLYPKESYFVYPTLADRTGDYLQIESFTMYGFNLYQNAHLIRQIVDENGPITNITYTIDADSRITQTSVVKIGATYADTVLYKLQYETFLRRP